MTKDGKKEYHLQPQNKLQWSGDRRSIVYPTKLPFVCFSGETGTPGFRNEELSKKL